MEFFEEVASNSADIEYLKARITIEKLHELCAFFTVIEDLKTTGTVYSDWGHQTLSRDEIKKGVRFSLLTCPHALSWTVTLEDSDRTLLVHCATNKKRHDEEFVDSILEFMRDWSAGLSSAF